MSFYVSSRTFLTNEEARSLSPAHARVLKSLAGRVRILAELATGLAVPDDEEPPVTTRNPQGLLGVDFSGPPWGSAFRHPLAVSVNLDDPMEWAGASEVGRPPMVQAIVLYCRPHAQHAGAPYSRGYISLVARLASAGSVNVTTSIYKVNEDGSRSFVSAETEAVTSTTPDVKSLDDAFLPLVPGFNCFELAIEVDADSPEVVISDLSINQRVKRKHT